MAGGKSHPFVYCLNHEKKVQMLEKPLKREKRNIPMSLKEKNGKYVVSSYAKLDCVIHVLECPKCENKIEKVWINGEP